MRTDKERRPNVEALSYEIVRGRGDRRKVAETIRVVCRSVSRREKRCTCMRPCLVPARWRSALKKSKTYRLAT